MKKDINFRHATTLAAATVEISNSSAAYMKLLDLLINVTHHDGALEEYKEVWLPIIQDELERRQKELSAEERAAFVSFTKRILENTDDEAALGREAVEVAHRMLAAVPLTTLKDVQT